MSKFVENVYQGYGSNSHVVRNQADVYQAKRPSVGDANPRLQYKKTQIQNLN